MIFLTKPSNFKANFECVSCFVETLGDILVLLRQDYKPQGNTWGLPAGKREKDEEPLEAMVRELGEEIGLVAQPSKVDYYSTVYVRYPDVDFVYHMFRLQLPQKITIILNPREHKEFRWTSPVNALTMDLVPDLGECIRISYGLRQD